MDKQASIHKSLQYPRTLPRRDLFLLPLISVLTVLFMVTAAEMVARAAITTQGDDACLVSDQRLGLKYKPNCVSKIKSFESPWVVNRYNACGYRTDAPCGPAPAGVRRLALLGSSVAQGYLVQQADTFATRTAEALTQRCSAPVEVQDLGGYLVFWTRVVNRVDDALALKPDAVMLQVSTYDLERPDEGEGAVTGQITGPRKDSLVLQLHDIVNGSAAWGVVQHFLFQNVDLYLSLYLRSGNKAAYLHKPLNPFWRGQMDHYDQMVGAIADRFHAAGIPMALVFVPQRAQAELAAKSSVPSDIHPYVINQELARIAARHGVAFIDTTAAVTSAPSVTSLYYAVDGHLDGRGHIRVAPAIVDGITADLPPFQDCRPKRQASSSLARSAFSR